MTKYAPIVTYMLRNAYSEDGDYAEVRIKQHNMDDDKGVWVIGDVHGCYETLKLLLSHIPKDANICFTGDLVDRGPKSKEVLDLVIDNGYDCVMGNHDLMFLGALAQCTEKYKSIPMQVPLWCYATWMHHGGVETLKSFGCELEDIPEKYVKWLSNLPIYIQYPIYDDKGQELMVSHSCLGQGWTLEDAANNIWSEEGLMWRRNGYKIPDGFFHVFGHSPYSREPHIERNHANIDTGVYYPVSERIAKEWDGPARGRLTAIHHPSGYVMSVNRVDLIYEGEEYEMALDEKTSK